jgi:hypothetical protein
MRPSALPPPGLTINGMEATTMAKPTPTTIAYPASTRSKWRETFKVHPAADLLMGDAASRVDIKPTTDNKGRSQPISKTSTAKPRAKEIALREARKAAKITADKYIAPLPPKTKRRDHAGD